MVRTSMICMELYELTHAKYLDFYHLHNVHFVKGFHYLGQLHENSFLKIALDLITDGQVHFAEQGSHVDTVVIGKGTQCKEYTIYNGKKQMEAHLKKQFPNDTKAVEELFKIMKVFG